MFKSQFEMFGVGWDGKPHPLLEAHLPADRPIPTLEELAEEANIVMESEFDYGPEVFERSPKNTALDLLRLQYAHCECRYFAFALRDGANALAASFLLLTFYISSVHRARRHLEVRNFPLFGLALSLWVMLYTWMSEQRMR